MDDLKFYVSRFLRRFHWFLAIFTVITAISVTVAMTLPPAYVSELRLLLESQQISDQLAESTATTPAPELLQIIEQRLMTRENLLRIARDQRVFKDQREMSPDEIVQAMRAHTKIRKRVGRSTAAVMQITFEAYRPEKAAGVLNEYLSLILAEESELRTGRASSTMDFFTQQAQDLSQELDAKNAAIITFKNEHADALPETLNFRMTQRNTVEERVARITSEISTLQSQREQILLVYEATGRVGSQGGPKSPEEQRFEKLQVQLDEALTVYSEQHPAVRQLRARVDQARAAFEASAASVPEQDENIDDQVQDAALRIQLADIDTRIAGLEREKDELSKRMAELDESIARIPENKIILDGLIRDLQNTQSQYNQAVDRLSKASMGERIELASRGQRISVTEPPAVPTEPTKPDRMRLAILGAAMGAAAGLGLVFLLEFVNGSLKRPADIVRNFDVMPIASIPYIQSRRQQMVERGIKLSLIVIILVGIPAAIYAVHVYYLPLDLLADSVMNKLGVRL